MPRSRHGGRNSRSGSPASAGPTCGPGIMTSDGGISTRRRDGAEGVTMERLAEAARDGLRTDMPAFEPGDTVRVMVRVKEGEKERLQAFEGLVIAKRGGGISENFTVRKISAGVGVERIFPMHSPILASVDVVRRGRVRRAKLYYLRNLSGKAARIKEKRDR